jgi:hypothetical protein
MMLQFAFGPGPASANSCSGSATHADGTMARDPSLEELALAAAARAWWEAGRPDGWSLEQHLADPSAGCSGTAQDRALAQTVAHWVGQAR